MNIRKYFISLFLGSLALLTLVSCADDELGKDGGDKDTAVSFIVSQAQDDARAAKDMPATRAAFASRLALQGLTPEDLASRRISVKGADDLCLIETTTAGIDDATRLTTTATRANVTGETTGKFADGDKFAAIGYRGATSGAGIDRQWFYNEEANNDGTLVNAINWSWQQPWGKFYAVFPKPYSKLALSAANPSAVPTVDFEVEPDVKDQKDLMTAYSGEVRYATQYVPPTTDLKFHHALTAVRFKVGQNLSWNKNITKIEITGAMSKGRYTLPAIAGHAGTWDTLTAPATFVLGGDGTVSASTSEAVNNIIVGKPGDNFTFFMIPQQLTDKGVHVKVYFSDGSTPIDATLKGEWKPGTTKVYALSEKTTNWNYVLNVTQTMPAPVAYDQTAAGNYSITSYREDPTTHTQQAVAWKIVGYEESADGGNTWSALSNTKPAWLDALPVTESAGGTVPVTGVASVQKAAFVDKLAEYNKVLRDAPAKGSPGNYYNLSNATGGATVMNTANSYLISAPGYYRIPLVYGNAIKAGADNPSSYKTSNTGARVLSNFKDHAGVNIDNPWITQTNGGTNAPDGAKIVWTDQSGIVEAGSLALEGSGTNAFVRFRIPQDKIRNGNAVIAVTKGGTVVWSWHLWFAHSDELNTIPVVNYQNVTYSFTTQTLGFAYRKWEGTSYDKPRQVRIKVEQTLGNGSPVVKQHGYITITQNPGSVKTISSTHYQFGRKDAMPGIDVVADGSFIKNGGNNMSIQNGIQHPETFYTDGTSWYDNPPTGYSYYNLWSMDNTTTGYNDNLVVKTIYDPCPVGLKMPAGNAFTGFTLNGKNNGTPNIDGTWNKGYTFKSKSGGNTVYFPVSGSRDNSNGSLNVAGSFGYYWSAVPNPTLNACGFGFSPGYVVPEGGASRPSGFAVRPVAE